LRRWLAGGQNTFFDGKENSIDFWHPVEKFLDKNIGKK